MSAVSSNTIPISIYEQWKEDVSIKGQEFDYDPMVNISIDLGRGRLNLCYSNYFDYNSNFVSNRQKIDVVKRIKENKVSKYFLYSYFLDRTLPLLENLVRMRIPSDELSDKLEIASFKFHGHDLIVVGEYHVNPICVQIKQNLFESSFAGRCAYFPEGLIAGKEKDLALTSLFGFQKNTHLIFGIEDFLSHTLGQLFWSIINLGINSEDSNLVINPENFEFAEVLSWILTFPEGTLHFRNYGKQFKNAGELQKYIDLSVHQNYGLSIKEIILEFSKSDKITKSDWFLILQGFANYLIKTFEGSSAYFLHYCDFLNQSLENLKSGHFDTNPIMIEFSSIREQFFIEHFRQAFVKIPKGMPIVLNIGKGHINNIVSLLSQLTLVPEKEMSESKETKEIKA